VRPASRAASRTILQEEQDIRNYLAGVVALALLTGCGKTTVDRPKEPAEPPEPAIRQVVNTGAGEATKYATTDEGRERIWTVQWKEGQIDYSGEKDIGGTMETVTGTIYQKNQPVSYFSADYAVADKKTALLQLSGKVKVWANENALPKNELGLPAVSRAVLRCDKVDWLASRKLVQASGNVTFETDAYTAGTFKELIVTPKMDSFGTPDQFPPIPNKTK
jgi:hypothetical protein